MSLISSIFSILPKVVNILDVNTSNIEKIENQFKIARKVNNLVITPVYLLLAITLAFYLFKWLGNNYYLKSVWFFISFCVGIIIYTSIINSKKEKKQRYNENNYLFFGTLIAFLAITSYLTLIIGTFYFSDFNFKYVSILISISGLIGFYFMIKISYTFLSVYPSRFSTIAIKKPIFKYSLADGSELEAILINITRKGDYIVKSKVTVYQNLNNSESIITLNHALNITEEEILINKLQILSMTYLGEMESSEESS